VARSLVPALALVVLGVGVSDAAFGQSDVCDRECLTGFADRFLKSIVEHEPGRAQLSKTAKYTENGQTLRPGDGLWITASEDAAYRLYAADPAAGQVALLAVIKENGVPVILALRLKIENRLVQQAEAIVSRNEPMGLNRPDLLVTPRAVFLETLAMEDRAPRENLLGIVNTYFDGLDENDTGRRVPFDKECQKVENGIETAASTDNSAEPFRRLSCQEQMNTGFSKMITGVRERRFLVVDDERGLVFAVAFFDHSGLIKIVRLNDGTSMAVPPAALKPYTLMTAHLFKIKNGKIRQIEVVELPVPYGMRSGWAR
jgi:hypothetical protein